MAERDSCRRHGAWRAAQSSGELVFPGGHVTGLAALLPGLEEGEAAIKRPGQAGD